MTKEQSRQPSGFNFTENERLFGRISHQRFLGFVRESETRVHEITETTNSYGEFLFVTLSRCDDPEQGSLTFWGMGLHEHRERWVVDSWEWYNSHQTPDKLPVITREEALEKIAEREAYVKANATSEPQSRRAQMYEILADLTDDDAALTEMEDMGDLAWWLLGDDDLDEK